MSCITHHHACDCREARFKVLEAENAKLREALEHIAATDTANADTGPDLEWHRRWRHTAKACAQEALKDPQGKEE